MRTVGPRPCSPAGVRVCTVIFFWKLSSDTPLYMRAAPQPPHLTITTRFPRELSPGRLPMVDDAVRAGAQMT